jgi:arsenate reductase
MPRPVKVLFVCPHGAAKSVIAAEHFAGLARAAGHRVDAVSAGIEPDEQIPPPVVQGLADDGFDVRGRTPRRLENENLTEADVVVSFGCSLGAGSPPQRLLRWDAIPAVSDGYEPARDAILGRLRTLLADMWPGEPVPARD